MKKSISYLLSFLGIIFLCSSVVLSIIKLTILNKDYIKNSFAKTDYYVGVDQNIKHNIELIMQSTGLSEDILDNIYSEEELKTMIDDYIDQIYSFNTKELDITIIRNNLENNIDNFIKTHNYSVTNRSYITSFLDSAMRIVQSEVTFYEVPNNFIDEFKKVVLLIDKVWLISIIAFIIDLLLLLILRFKKVGIIFLANGFIIMFLLFVLESKIDINNVELISTHLSKTIKMCYNECYRIAFISGIVSNVLGVIFLIFSNIIPAKKSKSKKTS